MLTLQSRPFTDRGVSVATTFVLAPAMVMAIAYDVRLVLLPLAGLAAIWALTTHVHSLLSGLVVLRTLSDSRLIEESVGFAINVGIAATAIIAAISLILRRMSKIDSVVFIILGLVTGSALIAMSNFGMDASILNEYTRFISIVAISVLARYACVKLGSRAFARSLVVTSVPAMALIVAGFLGSIPGLYTSETGSFGTFGNKNIASLYLALLMVLCLFCYIRFKDRIFLFGLLSAMICSVMAVSLGGITASIIGLGVVLLTETITIGAAKKFAMIVVGALIVYALFTSSPFAARIDELSREGVYVAAAGEQTNSLNWRLSNWNALISLWREKPTQGWGFGSTSEAIQPLGRQPHGEPVRVLVEAGLVGLLAVGSFLIWTLRRSLLTSKFRPLLLGVIAAVAVNSLVSNTLAYVAPMYLLMCIWQTASGDIEGRKVARSTTNISFGHR